MSLRQIIRKNLWISGAVILGFVSGEVIMPYTTERIPRGSSENLTFTRSLKDIYDAPKEYESDTYTVSPGDGRVVLTPTIRERNRESDQSILRFLSNAHLGKFAIGGFLAFGVGLFGYSLSQKEHSQNRIQSRPQQYSYRRRL